MPDAYRAHSDLLRPVAMTSQTVACSSARLLQRISFKRRTLPSAPAEARVLPSGLTVTSATERV
jgi:hypothetical protein